MSRSDRQITSLFWSGLQKGSPFLRGRWFESWPVVAWLAVVEVLVVQDSDKTVLS
jgi:hypothetical protein